MKTANLALRPAILLSLVAGLTVTAGVLAPPSILAQEGPAQTVGSGSNIPLSADAPDQYVVKTGDTLWDISKVFLREPWYWPEIWYVNPQIANPHLIYPGDVLKLVYVDGQPRLTVAQRGGENVEGGRGGKRLSPEVRRQPLSQAVTAIPYDIVASFMGRPTLLTKEQVKSAPYVVAMRDSHMIGAIGNEVYARGIGEAAAETRYSVVHIEEELRDPDNNKLLGYSGIYVGSGPVATEGDPAKLLMTDSAREVLQGDKLFPESVDVNVDFVPHAPADEIDASIIAVRSHTVMGQYQVVALNKGSNDGLEPGHILAAYQRGAVVRDTFAEGGLAARRTSRSSNFGKQVQLPDERAGVIMVFKAFDNLSYALVMETTHEIRQGDRAKNP
ncbi:LysM peptidoglycan-binding domain-containing protein [Steroidobacter sp. S1-65]|uniref:LysM peptidoglycan-binding domain-containing protein n=1 Tax=Steroidobacter gossypii TaxID=2805490 RepID=A0ABS1WTW0_9GAMM|nr:LysM peptidoglycan-binding domain-containing protein [Steroidobacter gossypii]MBM0104416.1 LysM peptidoglycan-binding domain-containing protein [Steroidobacter gossypii]